MSSTADTSYKNTGGRQTKFASIPDPPADASPELRKWMAAIKETVEVREGKRGNNLDRSIIVRDLFDQEFTNKYWPDGSGSNPNTSPGAAQGDDTPPGPVGNFEIDVSGLSQNVLTWTNPTDADLAHVEIWAAHIGGIAVWGPKGSYPLDEMLRFEHNGFNYIYKVIAVDPEGTGATELTGVSPEDPLYGASGTSTRCWMRQGYPYRKVSNAGPKGIIHEPTETWTHGVGTGDDPTQDWYYWAKAVDDAGNFSQWNPDGGEGLFALAKTNVGITPDPTNLMICESGSTTEFNSLDISLCWSPSTKYNVKDYIVDIIPTSTITEAAPDGVRIRHVENIRGTKWVYTYTDNKADNGGTAEDELTFRLWAVDTYDKVSSGYDEISVYNPPPADVGGMKSFQWMNGVQFMWDANTEPDLDVYRYRYRIINEPMTPWSDYFEVTSPGVSIFLTEDQRSAYADGATFEIWVWAVDTWGNVSANAATDTETTDILHVEPKDIDDFAIDASKMFFKIPVLEGENWSFASLRVSWNQHNIYFNGACYQIAAGSLAVADANSRGYIYWRTDHKTGAGAGTKADPWISYYLTSTNHPAGDTESSPVQPDLLGSEGWIIAVNTGTGYDVAWNAIANQVIGSAWIMDAAINNAKIADATITSAKIVDLTASLIKAGTLQSLYWDSGGGGMYFNVNSGDFKIGDSPTDIALEWDNTVKQLTLKGAIVQTPDGTGYPITLYRGAWGNHAVGTVFYEADTVTYGGSTWVCISQHTKNATNFPDEVPPGSAYWDVYAQAGEKGDDGIAGERGAGVTYRGEYAEIYTTTDFVSTADIRDVVKYSGSYYICKSSHGPTTGGLHDPRETAYWEGFGASFSSVATGLLLANDATILQTLVFGNAATRTGAIRSFGKDSYSSNVEGFWMGWDGGVPKVNIGDGTKYLKWTGTALSIGGDVIATGNIQGNAISQMRVGTNPNYYSFISFLGKWLTLADIEMTIEDSGGSGVLLTGSTIIYGSAGHRPLFIQWVDETPGVGVPTYQLGIYQYPSGITLFALGKWGAVIAKQSVDDVGGVCPTGYNNKSIITGLHIKR